MEIKKFFKSRSKAFIEKAFGLRIYRSRRTKHADAEISRLRSWAPGDVIFDVGANDGRSISRLRQHIPDPEIYAFEPVSSAFEKLVQRSEHLDNVHCFRLALGAESGQREIYVNEIDAMSSFYSEWGNSIGPEWATAVGKETVEVATVDEVMEDQGVDFIHLLKIDTEGHDLEVLKGAQAALASSRIAIIQVEIRFDMPGLGLHHFRRYLEPAGYHLYGLYNQCKVAAKPPAEWTAEEVDGYDPKALSYADAVFICESL